MRAAVSPEIASTAFFSSAVSLSYRPWFIMNTKLVLYRPPGKVVAYRMILSILKDSVDSAGKSVPSMTPPDSSSYESGAGLSVTFMPSALEISLTMPPPTRNFRPARSSALLIGRLVLKTMPGPCVK